MPSSEFDLIARLVERLPPPGPRVRVGSGDDAAVTESAEAASATTVDAIVEGIHFTLPEFPLPAVGRKALAGALSDLAAMGAEPGEAYIALGAPEHLSEEDLLAVGDGFAEVAEREGVSVAGGDVTRAPVLSLAVTCIGHERPGIGLVTRGGAQPGEAVAVTGELGGAAAALALLKDKSLAAGTLDDETREGLLARQLDPRPRLAAGLGLAASGANAMIDISDGLGADAGHLARASGVALVIDLGLVPLAGGAAEVAGSAERARELTIGGGEDFELLVCLPAERLPAATKAVEKSGYPLTRIGEAVEGEPGTVTDTDGHRLESAGFDHMRGSRAGSG